MARVLPEELACGARRGHGRVLPEELVWTHAPAPAPATMKKKGRRVFPEELVSEKTPPRYVEKKADSREELARLRRFGRRTQLAEKVWLVIDRVQCFGIVWICSQAWPWPTLWLEWTKWAAFANADLAVYGKNGAGNGTTGGGLDRSVYGEMPGYLSKIALPVVASAALTMMTDQKRTKKTLFRLAVLLYVPCGIVLARLFQCEYLPAGNRPGLRLSVDPSYSCFGRTPFFARVILGPIAASFLIVVLRHVGARGEDACEFEGSEDHENAIQALEIEHVLRVDDYDDYESGDAWIISSYCRWAACRESRTLVRKLLLVACFGCLYRLSRSQGVAILFVSLYFAIPDLARPPYRHTSSNFLFCVTEVASVTTSVYAMLTAWGLRSATVMPKQQSLALFAVNGSAALLSLLSMVWWQESKAAVSVRKAAEAHGWKTVREWIDSSRRARTAAARCRAWRPIETAPIGEVEKLMGIVRNHWLRAAEHRKDRVFEIILRKSLDELVIAHQDTASGVLQCRRRRQHETTGFEWLCDAAEFDGEAVRSRYETQSLLVPRRRVLLMKLLALRAFTERVTTKH